MEVGMCHWMYACVRTVVRAMQREAMVLFDAMAAMVQAKRCGAMDVASVRITLDSRRVERHGEYGDDTHHRAIVRILRIALRPTDGDRRCETTGIDERFKRTRTRRGDEHISA
jgi:hypothetical protein